MKFEDITGNRKAVETLRRYVDTNRIPHAIMLSGPSGVGKMRLARAFVQYLHCSNRRNGESCGQCASCRQHENLNNPDLHFEYPVLKKGSKAAFSSDYSEQWAALLKTDEYMSWQSWLKLMDAENKQPVIYVSQAAEISEIAARTTFQESHKVFIVWLPEKLQPDAANKLLKLIEEPYADTLFVFVSNDSRSILPTVFSRVQRINLLPVEEKDISALLSSKGVEKYDADNIARLAEGSIGKALQLSSQHDEDREFGELFRKIMRAAYARQVALLRQTADDTSGMGREKCRRFLTYCARMVRENFIYNLNMPALNLQTREEQEFSLRFAPYIHEKNVEDLLDEFSKAEHDISRNANAKIVLFSLFLSLCMLIRTRTPN